MRQLKVKGQLKIATQLSPCLPSSNLPSYGTYLSPIRVNQPQNQNPQGTK